MKNILVTTMALLVGLFWAVSAQAQMPTWNAEQSEVWAFVEQSWVDDAAENGRWPADYTHANAVGWPSNMPAPEGRDDWIERSRFTDEQETVLRYSVTPLAIAVVNDTAVVHYLVVLNIENAQGEHEQVVVRQVETLVRDNGAWLYLSASGMPMDLGGG